MSEQIVEQGNTETQATERELWPSPGSKIKKIREELGLTREQVSEALYITVHYVKALENDDYDKLPGRTFTKGYFKSYAEFLGTDVVEIINCYQNYIQAGDDTARQEDDARKAQGNKKLIVWVLLAVFLVALLIGLALWMSGDANASEARQAGQLNSQSQLYELNT